MMYTVERYGGDALASQIASNLNYAGKLKNEILKTEPMLVRVLDENDKLILEGPWRDVMKGVRKLL